MKEKISGIKKIIQEIKDTILKIQKNNTQQLTQEIKYPSRENKRNENIF